MKKLNPPYEIKVNGEKEVRKVLRKLEKMGYKWHSGHNPTDIVEETKNVKYAKSLCVSSNTNIGMSLTNPCYSTVIEAADFLADEKETIVIYRNGDETVALDKTTGKKAVAKCHPDDEYDFYTGAMLAFERLVKAPKEEVREVKRRAKAGEYVKIVEVVENTKDYKVGDVLKIVTVDEWGDPYYKHMPSKFLYEREYVVLENYQPAEEPPRRKLYNGKVVCVDNMHNTGSYTVGKIYEIKDGILTNDNGTKLGKGVAICSFKDWEVFTSSKFVEIVE